MMIALVISFALPVGLCIWFRIREKADLMPFFVGCAVMILFAFVLEQLVHRVVLNSSAGETIRNTPWIYALYGGCMAAVFEESGRFLAFKTVLRKLRGNNANALMYGAGHGGIEAIVVLGITSINNLFYSFLINTGNTQMLTAPLSGNQAALEQVNTAIRQLTTVPSWQFLLGGAERIFAVILQIALSVLVWFAAKEKGKGYLFLVAVCMHVAGDALTVYLAQTGVSVIVIELIVGIAALSLAAGAGKLLHADSGMQVR